MCTVPAALAVGDSVYFVRKITAEGCIDNEGVSNELLITFKCGGGHGMFYQGNRHIGWANSGAVTGWNNTADTSATWTVDPLPCPVGWRLPTREEYQALVVAGGSPAANGSTWADVNDRGNAVAGRFFGSKHTTCSLPNSMSGCVFLPAAGMRASNGAQYHGVNAYYWSTTQGNILNFTASTTTTIAFSKQYATPVRCVQ